MRSHLTPDEIESYRRDGFVVLRRFYDIAREIEPIQQAIGDVISLVRADQGLPQGDTQPPGNFDTSFGELVALDRKLGGRVYDAVKQIPAFVRLVCSRGHESVYRQVSGSDCVGVAGGGHGIRIDIAHEERFRTDWHQEYPAQLRSLDGAVFWSPLVPVTRELGPVQICVGSHHDGLVPVRTSDPDHPEKSGAYGLVLADRERRVASYEQVAPDMFPGDLLLMHFLTLHASGPNVGRRARWSMQSRMFNFADPTGRGHGWSGSFAAGKDFGALHPELLVGPA